MSKSNPYSGASLRHDGENSHLSALLKKLRPFQLEAFQFATTGKTYHRQFARDENDDESSFSYDPKYLGKGRILLADEMGLGKTVSSLAIMTYYMKEWPLLILCPASLRHTWPSEIEKFLPGISPMAVHVISGFDDTDWVKKRRQLQIVVATYSLLQTRSAVARVLQDFDFECVICDESHNLKERKSQRCQLAMPILQKAKRLILLSGTPALARPVELWSQVHSIAPDLFGSYTKYTKEYCDARRGRFGWDVSGLSNAKELHLKLRQVMVRRLKSDVLTELPPKQRSIVPTNIDKTHEKDCRELIEDLKATRLSVADLVGGEAVSANFEARRLLMAAYMQSGIGKAPCVAQYLLDWLDGAGTQKILVFCHHQEVMDVLEKAVAKRFKGVGHIRIDGSVDTKERALRVKKFQTTSSTRVALLSMTAAGVGLTLTAASSVLFAELHWTPGVIAQAEDRCHRIGQQNAVNVMYCVCKDEDKSVDLSLWAMLGKKVGNLGRVIDGCSNASLEAEEGGESQQRGGESAQDEVTRFFAETAEGKKNKTASKTPVKGSIQSFFKVARKDSKKHEKTKQDAVNLPLADKHGTSPELRNKDRAEWACESCTFLNSKPRPKNGWLACAMCGATFMETSDDSAQQVKSRPVTPKEAEVVLLEDTKVRAKLSRRPSSKSNSSCREPEVIVLDDSNTTSARSSDIEIITIDDEDDDEKPTSVVTPSKKNQSPLLGFSVSKNSGRITLHDGATGERFPYNFDIDQAITEETTDRLLESEVTRAGVSHRNTRIEFDDDEIIRLLSPAVKDLRTRQRIEGRRQEKKCRREVKEFIINYLSLREVEKKALKESGAPLYSTNLQQQVAKLLTTDVTCSTDRYIGGAKERARENSERGKASDNDRAVLEGRACAWCGGSLSHAARIAGVESTYCSQRCAEEGRLKRAGGNQVRTQVFGLEGGICKKCGIDAHALYVRIHALEPAERLNALINAKWSLPKGSQSLQNLLQNPKEGDFWQADHIVAVAEGGGGCGLENLRTLCTPCHQSETNRLRARLKLASTKPGESDGKRKQMDIRSSFYGAHKKPKL